MIVSFYDKNFKGLQNNASLVIAKKSYKLIKKPQELNTLSCVCEAFTEDFQPTFVVIKDDKGGYVYGSLAGIPVLNENNQTEITGTDLKSMFSSDVYLTYGTYSTVNDWITYLFNQWNSQVNQGSFVCQLDFEENVDIGDYQPANEAGVYNALDELQAICRFYNLYIESKLDLVNKKVIFTIGLMMQRTRNIRLWEYGIKNYGKWIANVNETQGLVKSGNTLLPSTNRWILTSDNNITSNASLRDIYPVKRKLFISEKSVQEADKLALTELLNSLYNEDININISDVNFETNFAIYVKKGQQLYKNLPCGALEYDSSGLIKVQIGFRYSDINYL